MKCFGHVRSGHVHTKSLQSCPIIRNRMDPPHSSVHKIFQARILEWVAISSSRGSSQPRDWIRVSCIEGRLLTVWTKTFCVITLLRYSLHTIKFTPFKCKFNDFKNIYRVLWPSPWSSLRTFGACALGWPRGMVWGGRREEGSGWGTHVYLWRIYFDIWQNQYNIVKLKNKIKFKKKNKKKEHSHNPKEMHIFTKTCYFSSYW